MEFNGTFELEDTTAEEVWLALSDPALVAEALPGCEFLVRVDDGDVDFDALREEYADRERELTADADVIEERAFEEGATYAALVQISVGPVNPTFETVVTIDEREFPEMSASGEGSSGDSSFEMSSSMALSETDDGVAVDWNTEADVFGRVAQMGQRVVNPVANRVVKRFFSSVQQQLRDLEMAGEGDGEEESGKRSLTDRLLGRSKGDK
ncbi:CoxG family protein [Halobacterium litoreum]|uniref:CoxG family protein n=1 Tax=Halobacterium litoreum TaxID=2039234 RepID=A0ABD5NEX1_9EURY|nr:SRPBCC domain-containing protein [Halobacterium litoreum]UHH13220.1 carbon monoxide dehydrogenase [Halobacterium litoreum]